MDDVQANHLLNDVRRELAKIADMLNDAKLHPARHADTPCAITVHYCPLHAWVLAALNGIDQLDARLSTITAEQAVGGALS